MTSLSPILQTFIIAIAIVAASWISNSSTEMMGKIETRLDVIEARLDGLEGSVVRIETKIDNFISSLAAGQAQHPTPASSR